MAKIIVFIVINSGIDGRERDVIVYANESESERDKWFNASKNKDWYRKSEKIIDAEKIKTDVIRKMDGIEKMVMGFSECEIVESKSNCKIIAPMAKIIVFTVIDNGIEGREKDRIVYANESEADRDKWFNSSKNKNWYRKAEKIIDAEKIKTDVIRKMDGIEKMVMGFSECEIVESKSNCKIIAPTTRMKGEF